MTKLLPRSLPGLAETNLAIFLDLYGNAGSSKTLAGPYREPHFRQRRMGGGHVFCYALPEETNRVVYAVVANATTLYYHKQYVEDAIYRQEL